MIAISNKFLIFSRANSTIDTMDRTPLSNAVFGSLPTELFQEITSYLTDPRDLAALVNCCKTFLLALGKELIHIASAKEWAAAHAENEALRLWDNSARES
jgi:hypothetical protein